MLHDYWKQHCEANMGCRYDITCVCRDLPCLQTALPKYPHAHMCLVVGCVLVFSHNSTLMEEDVFASFSENPAKRSMIIALIVIPVRD